ncbi:MAG: hypothetical protein M0P10_06050 [Sphaerochaetaceae bacterium]|nr:hypothetical protein [Sphaerochaetaceae bacterium]
MKHRILEKRLSLTGILCIESPLQKHRETSLQRYVFFLYELFHPSKIDREILARTCAHEGRNSKLLYLAFR